MAIRARPPLRTTRLPVRRVRSARRRLSRPVWLILGAMLAGLAFIGCAESSGPEPTPTPGPTAVLLPGAAYSCVVADQFSATFTSDLTYYDDKTWPALVQLGPRDCPPGAVVLRCDYCMDGVGGAYELPTGDVQVTFVIRAPQTGGASPYGLVVTFNADKIERVILTGNGDPVELHRQ